MKLSVAITTSLVIVLVAGFIGISFVDVNPPKKEITKTIPNERFFD